MTERLHQTLVELCRIPSPSRCEGRVASYIRQRVAALGLAVEEDDAGPALESDTGNLIVRTEGTGEPLLLAAHMDTVPPSPVDGQVPVVVDGDRVHTGGRSVLGGDDKAGVAVALALLEQAARNPAAYRPLDVVFTVQEELGLRGAGHLDAARLRARLGFVLDGDTRVGAAIHHAPYKARFTIDVTGRAAHAAVNPEEGINAIQALGAIAAHLPTGRLSATSIANLGKIEGGGVTNVVPAHARLIGEARSLMPDELDTLHRRIEQIALTQAHRHNAQAACTWEMLYPGYFIPESAPVAVLFRQACAQAGLDATFSASSGGGDANQLNAKGIACLVFGLGMQRIHTPDEWILLSDLDRALAILGHACRA
jgi:tripeptide aminopeptidase